MLEVRVAADGFLPTWSETSSGHCSTSVKAGEIPIGSMSSSQSETAGLDRSWPRHMGLRLRESVSAANY